MYVQIDLKYISKHFLRYCFAGEYFKANIKMLLLNATTYQKHAPHLQVRSGTTSSSSPNKPNPKSVEIIVSYNHPFSQHTCNSNLGILSFPNPPLWRQTDRPALGILS